MQTKNFEKFITIHHTVKLIKHCFIYIIHSAAQDHSIWTQYVRYFSNKKFNAIAFIFYLIENHKTKN